VVSNGSSERQHAFQPVPPTSAPTSPSRTSPAAAARARRWCQLREQNWDSSFASAPVDGGTDGGAGDLATLGWEDLAFTMPQARGFLSDSRDPSSASSSRLLLLQRPLRGGSAGGPLVKPMAMGASFWTPQSLPSGTGVPYEDWYGSPLYAAYSRSIESGGASNPREKLTQALQGVHTELRSITEADGVGCDFDELLRCLEPLWQELQVPSESRCSTWQARQPAEEFALSLEHARGLLAFRDATVLVINGLQEHESLVAKLQREVGPTEQESPALAQLERIDSALQQFLATWSRRFAQPPWSESADSEQPPAQFIWRGADALAQIRLDSAALRQPSGSTIGSINRAAIPRRAAGPQNCADRAALNDARGLRAMLRSGGGPGGPALPPGMP